MNLPKLRIGDLELKLPIIQGGMGVGVSRSSLAGSVAKEGGLGVISAAQIGYEEEDFHNNTNEANVRALEKEITKAKNISPSGIIGVNIMVAMKNYADIVKASIKAKADVIISGAGLPMELPKLTEGANIKIVPIVSSLRATKVIIKKWVKKYNRYPDAIIVEGPKAGGHLGFKPEDLMGNIDFKKIVTDIKEYISEVENDIPVIAAGGIYSGSDIKEFIDLGIDGVQMSTRFVTTNECDAHIDYKQAYVNAQRDDIVIVKSPVGMPGRAIRNDFIKRLESTGKEKINSCYNCLKGCNPVETPYCITSKLINAVKGNLSDGLIFVGENAWKNDRIISVKELMEDITKEYNAVMP